VGIVPEITLSLWGPTQVNLYATPNNKTKLVSSERGLKARSKHASLAPQGEINCILMNLNPHMLINLGTNGNSK